MLIIEQCTCETVSHVVSEILTGVTSGHPWSIGICDSFMEASVTALDFISSLAYSHCSSNMAFVTGYIIYIKVS